MTDLIPTKNEIVKYGLQAHLTVEDRNIKLVKDLLKIYASYFDVRYEFDEREFPEFNRSTLPDIRRSIESNFSDFGFYKTVLDINDLDNLENNGVGDSIDDLADITVDLLEIKWRIENNSWANGLWYFKFIFRAHTEQHILDLLNYVKQKNAFNH